MHSEAVIERAVSCRAAGTALSCISLPGQRCCNNAYLEREFINYLKYGYGKEGQDERIQDGEEQAGADCL